MLKTECNSVYLIMIVNNACPSCGRSVVFSGHSDFLTNKTDRHDIYITDILLKVALSPIYQTLLVFEK